MKASMQLTSSELRSIARLQENTRSQSKANAVRLGVELGVMVTEAIRKGQKVLIETAPGDFERVVVPGVCK